MIHPMMKFEHFEAALQQIEMPPPDELATRITALPTAGSLIEPCTAWLFINLMLHRARQRWARKELQRHFPSFFVSEPDQEPQFKPVPGMPEWRLVFVCDVWGTIVHRVTGELIVVDRVRHRGEYIVFPHETQRDVTSRSPWDVPARLTATTGGLQTAIDELVAVRILLETDFYGLAWEDSEDPEAHRLSRRVSSMSRAVHNFRHLWDEPRNRLWLAAIIGDWPSANELASATMMRRFDAR